MHWPADSKTPADFSPSSRRTFLVSMAALALQACGGGGTDAGSAGPDAGTCAAGATATGSGSAAASFVHPGLLHTQADFDRMAAKVAANASPWIDDLKVLVANRYASATGLPDPQLALYRGNDGTHDENYMILARDIAAAYACALRWKVSGDVDCANKAVRIMNAWATTMTAIGGDSNRFLASGLYGHEFANAAEIMRSYSGWAAADFAAFQNYMRTVFYPVCSSFLADHNGADITHYWANWDLCNMAAIMAIGVLCDDHGMFEEAVTYFKTGAGNGAIAQAVYFLHDGNLGQWQESGRDQAHNTLGIALMGPICEMAWNQGIDLYGFDNNRFLAGAEYVAKANLIESGTSYHGVPYLAYNNADNVDQAVLSTVSQGSVRPAWALVSNHYVKRRGLAAPYTQKFAALVAPEGGGGNYGPNSTGFDQLGYGTLTCTRDALVSGLAPSGLTARSSAGSVILSWWGCAEGLSYNVKRAASACGTFTTLATGIADLLTYTDANVAAGTWYYVVTATTATGESAASGFVTSTTDLQLHTRLQFDETSGNSAADATGNGHTGTLVGGASFVAGRVGGAVSLDGVTGHVSLPDQLVEDLSDFTLSVWLKWNVATRNARVFDFGAGTGRYMTLRASAGATARLSTTVSGSHNERSIDTAVLPTGVWTHIVVTLSGTTQTLYVDGVAVGSIADMPFAPFRLGDTGRNWLGRSQSGTDPYLDGLIDDFRLYRNAMTADQVAGLFAS
jgi:hypothetical protein